MAADGRARSESVPLLPPARYLIDIDYQVVYVNIPCTCGMGLDGAL